jgi:hypothetical protein
MAPATSLLCTEMQKAYREVVVAYGQPWRMSATWSKAWSVPTNFTSFLSQ